MAKQTIDLGTTPNRGDGDPLRTAFRKINENFDELYAGNFAAPDQTASDLVPSVDATYDLGNAARQWADLHIADFIYLNGVRLETDAGGNLRVNGSLIEANSQGSLFGEDSTLLVDGINNAFNLNGTVKGNIIPDADEAYDIGSPTKKFRDLYLSGTTIYLGNTPLSINNGTLLVDGVAVSGTGGTGDITFSATTISAPNQDVIVIESKDSNGFGTARVTLNSEFGGDARFRAFSSESVDTFTLANGDFATGVWQDNGFGNGVVSFTGAQGIGDFFQNTLFKLTPDNVTISINGETPFVWNGGANGSGTDTPGFGTNPIVPATPIAITSIEFRYRSESFISVNYDNQEIRLNAQNGSITFDANNTIQMFGDSNIELQSGSDFSINSGQNISIGTSSSDSISLSTGDLNFTAFDDVNFRGSDSFRLRNTSTTQPIRIITDDNNTQKTWAFNVDGTLTFPDGSLALTNSVLANGLDADIKGSVFADDSTLLVDGVNGTIPYAVLSGAPAIPADVSDLTDTQGLLSTGNITFDGVKIQGAGTASGDGNGYATIELVPDTNLYANDQYLIIDPTAPSHIHMRAGGTQDSSNTELYLGGENSYFRVGAGSNPSLEIKATDNSVLVRTQGTVVTNNIYNNTTDFVTDIDPSLGFVISGWSQRNDEEIELNLFVPGLESFYTFLTSLGIGSDVVVTYSTVGGNQTFTSTVSQVFSGVAQFDPVTGWQRTSGRILGTLPVDQTGIVSINFPVTTTPQRDWTFSDTGSLTFPNGLTLSESTFTTPVDNNIGTVNFVTRSLIGGNFPEDLITHTVRITPYGLETDQNYVSVRTQNDQGFDIDETSSRFRIGDLPGNDVVSFYYGSGTPLSRSDLDIRTIRRGVDSGLATSVWISPENGDQQWRFSGEDGSLTIPGDIRSESSINIDINLSDSTLRRWRFGEDGDLTFPDTTVQTTAFTGNATTVDITNTNGIDTNYSITFVENRDGAEILRADVDLTFNSATNLLTAGNVTTGVLKIDDGVHEKFQTKSNAIGTVTHDCSSGHIFYHTLPSANWTVNLTNLNLAVGYATTVTLVIEQSATGYYPNAIQIDGNGVGLAWQGNTTPTPSSSRIDVVTFSILYDGLYTVLGQLTGF